jgi:PAS domain S-box-containing protein
MTMDAARIESSYMLQQIMQGLMEGVVISDRQGQLLFANRALEQLLGYEPGELVGLPWTALFAGHTPARPESWQSRSPYPSAKRYQGQLVHKNGTVVPVLASSRPLSSRGRREGFLSTFTDLRESQSLQAQIQQLAKPAFMGQHLASIIHELSNSLTILFLQAQWLAKKAPMEPAIEERLDVIRDQAKRMIQMVDELRATADPTQVQLETTNVNALLQRTLALQNHQLEADGIRVETRLEQNLPETGADPHRLQQVFVNLINNARHAIRETDREGQLAITTQTVAHNGANETRIQIQISDNGPGIPEEVLPRVFEAFFTTKTGNGMGLGLFICQQIVDKHEGKIWAENHPGVGVTFIIELPIRETAGLSALSLLDRGARPFTGPRARRVGPPKHHILVVDDEPVVAQTIGFFLKEAGFEVTIATDAQQALSLLQGKHVDVIVSDLSMPGVSGPDFWHAVQRRFPELADRIIFSTGDSGRRQWSAFLASSGCATIEKPFAPDALIRLIWETLPTRRETDLQSLSPVPA